MSAPIHSWLASAAICIAFVAAAPAARADEAPAADAANSEFTPAWRTSTDKGLAWLAKYYADDGKGSVAGGRQVSMAALAGLAFLADGNLPNRGRYGAEVARIAKFIVDTAGDDGFLSANDGGQMYGHGFATLFLAEVYGQSPDPKVKETLRRAIRLIVGCQNDEGGWRYQPRPTDADISVTVCQVMALRAARNAGIKVPKQTIDRAVDYVLRCQETDGGFRYVVQSSGSAFPRSAAGLATLYYAGTYKGRPIDSALAYLRQFKPGKGVADENGHFYYGHYYAVQAMYLAGGKDWAAWWPAIRETLLKRQQADGSWTGDNGPDYATAMALIILQVPNRLLPILQR